MRKKLVGAMLVVSAVAGMAEAQSGRGGGGGPQQVGQSSEPTARKQAVARMVSTGSVRIDGRLDEEVWGLATPIGDFVQSEPEEGAPPLEGMEVRFLYDAEALLVGARMRSREPAGIQAPMSRRDENVNQAEHILVSLDTYFDRRTAYTFGVTAAGVRFDQYHADDNRARVDRGFDPVWEARVSVDSGGWVAELRIPFNQLRFTGSEVQVWGVNVYRAVPSRNEQVYWSLVRRTERVWASRFGELRGIEGIEPTRRIELVPYGASSSTLNGNPNPANPFDQRQNVHSRAGLDAKMGLGPNVTLEATINPDFGQVEADPAEVNLSAFETFFNERRPFFIEGSRLLSGAVPRQAWDMGGTDYFYSRRIGARPGGSASADFVDFPQTSTILGATKLTGRLPSGTSVGMLAAVTGEQYARLYDVRSSSFDRARVAPQTVYGVGRLQQEFGPAGSTAALMVTTTHRGISPDESRGALMTRNAFTASGDSIMRFRDGEYELSTNLGVSYVGGDAPAIARLQRSSARYLQRPDAAHVRYDPTRTSMTGLKAGLSAERTGGRHWLWKATTEMISPEFEVNDLGRLMKADNLTGTAELRYRETQPGRLFRSYAVGLEQEGEWNLDRSVQAVSIGIFSDVTWRNFWNTNFNVNRSLPAQDQRLTRGGPTMATPPGWSTFLRVGNSFAARTRGNARVSYRSNDDGGFTFDVSLGGAVRPTPRWQLSLQPRYERRVDDRQYVTTVSDQGPGETYGRRYVFAFVDRSTLSTEIRLNYVFKPDVTLELYGEPFTASGRYYDFGELVAPGSGSRRKYAPHEVQSQPGGMLLISDEIGHFSLRDRDFNVMSFRSNLVLRWEWRPGSMLYAVWQQDRRESEVGAARVGFRDLVGSFGAMGSNVFAVKTTFWWGVR